MRAFGGVFLFLRVGVVVGVEGGRERCRLGKLGVVVVNEGVVNAVVGK
jgi:hypothetical protein